MSEETKYEKDLEERIEKLYELFQEDSDIYLEFQDIVSYLKTEVSRVEALEMELFNLKKDVENIFKLIKRTHENEGSLISEIESIGYIN